MGRPGFHLKRRRSRAEDQEINRLKSGLWLGNPSIDRSETEMIRVMFG